MAERKAGELAKRKAREAKEAREKEKRKAKEAKERAERKAKEAREKAKREAKEAKEKAKREAKEAKEREKREAKEAKEKAKKAEKTKPAKEKVEKAAEPSVDAGTYRGMVTLNITPPVDFAQLDVLKQALFGVEDLRVVMVGGAAGEGSRVLVSAEEPLPLINVLRGIPVVEEVAGKGDEIQVRLKAR